jgi:hypothetical protein
MKQKNRGSSITTAAVSLAAALIAVVPGARLRAAEDSAAAARPDLCRLLTQAEVSRALKVSIVRAEAPDTDEAGCEFSTRGSQTDAVAGHYAQLAKSSAASQGTTIDGPTEQLINTFAKGVFQESDSEKSSAATARHVGEFPVFTYAIQPGDAEQQMPLTRHTLAGLSPKGIKTVVNLGDEAFDSGGAMLTVRKGKTMIQFTYKACNCTTQDIVPLARKVVDAL